MPRPAERAKFAIRYATRHLLVSVAVALLAAMLVFLVWYPAPAARLLDVGPIYAVVLAVDVVCGPLLTLVLASPAKPRRELMLDFGLVGLIQLAALGYGLYALESARPVAYVFEQDRLVLVAKNELYTADCPEAAQPCPPAPGLWGIGQYVVQVDRMGGFHSLDLSLQGVSPAMRPATWGPWNWQDARLQSALRPLTALRADQQEKLAERQGTAYLARPELRYVPLVSSKTLDWIAVFDGQGQWVDSLPVDGFQ